MKKEKYLTDYMACTVATMLKEGRLGTAHVYNSTLNRIRDFNGDMPLKFNRITPHWLQEFQNYLLSRQLHWNSISTYMRMLRATYMRAVDHGLAPYRPRLFKGVYTGTRVTVKRALDASLIRRIKELRPTANKAVEQSRQLFLLMFMLRGIPFVDIAFMRRCDLQGDIISYRRRKTGAWLTVKVEPEAMKLVRKLQSTNPRSPYLFPFISDLSREPYRQYQSALRKFNTSLKLLARQLNCPYNLSSYCARHSWATIANYRNYQQELICNAMGHSSVKVTETYFKPHTDERIREMNRGILAYVFTGKNIRGKKGMLLCR